MNNSKLIALLKALNPTEFRQFNRYLKSSFFTQSEDVLRLYAYLRKYYPDFSSPKLEREKAFAYLYPKEKFNGPRLRNLLLKITKILEEYFIYLEFQANEFEKKKLLTRIYGKRNLSVIYQQKTEELLDDLERQPFRNVDYFYHRYLLQKDFYFHLNTTRQGAINKKVEDAFLNLNYFFAMERLRFGAELKSRERIYAEKYNFSQNNKTEFIPPKHNKTYNLFQKIVELIEYQNEQVYFEAKSLFLEINEKINLKTQQDILLYLLNYALSQIAQKGSSFMREAFELYKIGLAKSIFITEQKSFSGVSFLNIVLVGSGLKEYEWTKNFIKEYSSLLDKSAIENFKPLAEATLYFYQEAFSRAITIINTNKFSESIIDINAKLLVLRAYYELFLLDNTYWQLLNSCLKNYEKYLSRDTKLDESKIKGYVNFIHIFKKFLKITIQKKYNHQSISTLIELLNTMSPVTAKPWLLDKISSFK